MRPPVSLMLARSERELPLSRAGRGWIFEPKFDGWRAVLFTRLGVLQSRNETDLASRFPEITEAAAAQLGDVVLDGEIVALRGGRLDFGALTSTPQARASAGISIYFVAFDLLETDGRDLRDEPYNQRRIRLQELFDGVRPPLQLVPSTADRDAARVWMQPDVSSVGIEGVVAKLEDSRYRAGRSDSWVKVRQMTVVDAVIVGVTGLSGRVDEVVLARPDEDGELNIIGLSLPLSPDLRTRLSRSVTLTGEPPTTLSSGVFGRGRTEYRPAHPELVVEVEAEASVASFTNRLRPRVHRLREDLSPNDIT